jgi:hypothetical protein
LLRVYVVTCTRCDIWPLHVDYGMRVLRTNQAALRTTVPTRLSPVPPHQRSHACACCPQVDHASAAAVAAVAASTASGDTSKHGSIRRGRAGPSTDQHSLQFQVCCCRQAVHSPQVRAPKQPLPVHLHVLVVVWHRAMLRLHGTHAGSMSDVAKAFMCAICCQSARPELAASLRGPAVGWGQASLVLSLSD